MTTPSPTQLSPGIERWQLDAGVHVRMRTWGSETAVHFDGPGETMVVNELGAVAIAAIAAGCRDLAALEHWCRDRGFADAGDDLLSGLSSLLASLAELEIVEVRS